MPIAFGILVATLTYLICKDTSAYSLYMPLGLFIGLCLTALCFQSEREKHLLIKHDDPCISGETTEIITPDLKRLLSLQGQYLLSLSVVLGILFWYGNPIFIVYVDWKASIGL